MAAPVEVQQLIPTTSRVDSLKTCLNMEHPLQVKKQACPKLENSSDRPSGIRRAGFRSEQSIAIRRSARGLIESWIAYRAVEIFPPENKCLLLSKVESWRRRMTRRFLFSRLDSCSTPCGAPYPRLCDTFSTRESSATVRCASDQSVASVVLERGGLRVIGRAGAQIVMRLRRRPGFPAGCDKVRVERRASSRSASGRGPGQRRQGVS